MAKYRPAIKWSGSKGSQAQNILSFFPDRIDTYYEPFCGGASVLRALLSSEVIVERYVCSDLNRGLIDLWNKIKLSPDEVTDRYGAMWHEMNDIDDDKERKKNYFYSVRERYNKFKCPFDFMFIMRTTTNGMPRYNKQGDFNNSFHVTRDGINPETLGDILTEWSDLLNNKNVEFICQSFEDVSPQQGDFLYLDPPYANTKGMYFGGFDNRILWDWLRDKVKCPYLLSYDGVSGGVDNTHDVPKDLYDSHEYLMSGNSSFKRVIGNDLRATVHESLYIKK